MRRPAGGPPSLSGGARERRAAGRPARETPSASASGPLRRWARCRSRPAIPWSRCARRPATPSPRARATRARGQPRARAVPASRRPAPDGRKPAGRGRHRPGRRRSGGPGHPGDAPEDRSRRVARQVDGSRSRAGGGHGPTSPRGGQRGGQAAQEPPKAKPRSRGHVQPRITRPTATARGRGGGPRPRGLFGRGRRVVSSADDVVQRPTVPEAARRARPASPAASGEPHDPADRPRPPRSVPALWIARAVRASPPRRRPDLREPAARTPPSRRPTPRATQAPTMPPILPGDGSPGRRTAAWRPARHGGDPTGGGAAS